MVNSVNHLGKLYHQLTYRNAHFQIIDLPISPICREERSHIGAYLSFAIILSFSSYSFAVNSRHHAPAYAIYKKANFIVSYSLPFSADEENSSILLIFLYFRSSLIFEMMSFVKELFLLTISLTCLIHFGAGYTLVPGIAVSANSSIPRRQELRTFINNSTNLNIYLIALERMQQTSTNQLLSYYMISGIHGMNFAWDNDTGGNFNQGYGYCYHAHRLFPPWHRPYLSLYEKTLLDLATQIVQGFSAGTQKNVHLAALTTWRMPYWDWAMDPSLPSVLLNKNVAVTRMQNGALKSVSILNPLYSYRLQILNDPNTVIFPPPGPKTIETVRNPTVKSNTYVSQPTYTNIQMITAGAGFKSAVYDALTAVTDYNSFSNVADSPSSIEGVHGSVHVTVGGYNGATGIGGHMTYVPYSSFDPIFYLHHTNVDRLFAMWQVLNPNSYLTDDTTQDPNQDTELHPFRQTASQYWTSRLARNLTVFGYTYPELVGWNQQTVINAVNKLYGPTSSSGRKRKRALVPIDSVTSTTPPIVSNFIQSASDFLNIPTSINGQDISWTTSNEYRAQIQVSSTAANGPFTLCLFLGEPSSDQSNYAADPNFVGLVGFFVPSNVPQSHAKLIQGTVSLTTAVNKLIVTKQLADTTPDGIKSYLSQNLRVRIIGDKSNGFDSKGFQINIVTAPLNLPNKQNIMPIWGRFSSIYQGEQVDLASKINFLPSSNILSMIDQMTAIDSTS